MYIHTCFLKCQEKGKEWVHVKTIEQKDEAHKHEYCKLVFEAGASCIRKHFLHIDPTCGVVKCTADEAVLLPVQDVFRAGAG